jgi:hypothetical protein
LRQILPVNEGTGNNRGQKPSLSNQQKPLEGAEQDGYCDEDPG